MLSAFDLLNRRSVETDIKGVFVRFVAIVGVFIDRRFSDVRSGTLRGLRTILGGGIGVKGVSEEICPQDAIEAEKSQTSFYLKISLSL